MVIKPIKGGFRIRNVGFHYAGINGFLTKEYSHRNTQGVTQFLSLWCIGEMRDEYLAKHTEISSSILRFYIFIAESHTAIIILTVTIVVDIREVI